MLRVDKIGFRRLDYKYYAYNYVCAQILYSLKFSWFAKFP